MSETKILAVVYAAKSTKDRHLSIPEQFEDAREMCEENGWTIIGEYVDENFTAYSGNRGPGLAAAIKAAKETAADTNSQVMLVTQHTSRFARGNGDEPGAPKALVELYHEWARANVRGRLAENDLAMATSSAAAAQGEADHNESKRKGKSVRKGLKRRARDRGKLSGGPRPYGYRWTGPNLEKTLQIVPEEAVIVVRIFKATIAGVSQRALMRELIGEGIPTVNGRPWGQATIGRILANPIYRGAIRHDGEEYPGVHEPIVSEQLWQDAEKARLSAARRMGGRWPKGSHLLPGGLLRCGSCGYAMIPRTDPGRRNNYETYQCRGHRDRGPGFCNQPLVHRRLIDEAMLSELQSRYIDLDETRRRIGERQSADLTIARETLAHAELEAQKAADALTRIERDYIDNKITAERWNRLEAKLTEEGDAAAEALQRAREHIETIESAGALLDAEETLLRRLSDLKAAVAEGIGEAPDLNALRILLKQLFASVELLSAARPFGSGAPGILHTREDEDLHAGEYRLFLRLREEAFDLGELGAPKVPLSLETENETLTT